MFQCTWAELTKGSSALHVCWSCVVRRLSSLTFHIFDFSSKTAERNQPNLTGSKISTSSTTFVFFGPIGKTRRPPRPLIGWDIFDFSSGRNSTELGRKQDLNVLYHVVFFGLIGKTTWQSNVSDFLKHFRLLLWNRWIEFHGIEQEERSQRTLPICVFRADRNKQGGRPGLCFAETFSTSMKPLNGIQPNLTGSKISASSTKFVFFRPIGKTRRPPDLW